MLDMAVYVLFHAHLVEQTALFNLLVKEKTNFESKLTVLHFEKIDFVFKPACGRRIG